MKSSLLFCRTIVLLLALASARTICAASPDYIVTESSGAVIVPGTDDIGNHCDDCATVIALPFPVIFYDQVFTSATVWSNGNLTFSGGETCCTVCLPDISANNLISPGWTDFFTSDSGAGQGIFTSVSGTAPNRILNIEWRVQRCCNNGPPNNNFEVRLYEGQRRIDFIYGALSGGSFGGIGVQRDTGSQSTIVSPCLNIPAPGTQYTFTIPQTCADVPPDMIAWWRADGNADDSVGGHHGSLLGGATFGPGEVAQAFSFSGPEARVAAGDVDLAETFTIDAWINPDDVADYQGIVSKDNDTVARSYEFRVVAGGALQAFVFDENDNLTFYQTDNAVLTGGIWQHVAVTFDGNAGQGEKFKFYVNGVNVPASSLGTDAASTTNNSDVPVFIGIRGNGLNPFHGLIDEVEIFDRVLTTTEIASIYIAGSEGKCKCTPPPANMISWWPGEGNGSDIQDGNNLTFSGGEGYSSGEVGQAFSFNGSNSASAGNPANLNITGGQVTIDGWINPSADLADESWFFGKSGDGTTRYAIEWESGFLIARANTSGIQAEFTPPANNWTHLAVVYDGNASPTTKLYVNGELLASGSPSSGDLSASAAPFVIGAFGDGTRNFTGLVDEVEVFDRALSAEEIAALYHAGSAGKCRPCVSAPANMTSWWPADGNASDIQGGHNGTLQNGVTFAPGEVGQAFSFNGNNQYVLIGDPVPASLQIQNEITLDAWIYVTAYPAGELGLIVGSQLDGTHSGATIFLDSRTNPDGQIAPPGHIHFQIGGDGSWHVTNTNSQVPLNQWVHIAATRKANEDGKVYYNGVLQPSTSAPWTTGSISYDGSWFAIGQQKDIDRPFNGLIDEVEVFDRALSAEEIAAIYNAGSGGKCKPVVPFLRQFANISARADVGTSNKVAIGGFIIHSDGGATSLRGTRVGISPTKEVLIRGIGPSLGITGQLEDPFLELRDSNGALIVSNDNWGDAANAGDIPSGLTPGDPDEAAILQTLDADANYTAILKGAGNTTGIGLVEVYDLDVLGDSHLANISTRAFVSTGSERLIGGIIVQGGIPTRVVLRGVGPSLETQGIPVGQALQDPFLELHDGNGALLEANDDWASSAEAAAITASGLAPTHNKESAILFTPAPGNYTAILSGVSSGTGIGLVEAYNIGP